MLSYGFGCTAPDPPLEDYDNTTIGFKYSCNRTVSGARRWVQTSSVHQTGSRQTARHVRVTTRPTRPVRRPVAGSSPARLPGPLAEPDHPSSRPISITPRPSIAGGAEKLAVGRPRWGVRPPRGPAWPLPLCFMEWPFSLCLRTAAHRIASRPKSAASVCVAAPVVFYHPSSHSIPMAPPRVVRWPLLLCFVRFAKKLASFPIG